MDPTRYHLISSFMNPSNDFILRAFSLPSVFNSFSATTDELSYPLKTRNYLGWELMVGSVHGMVCFAAQHSPLLWNPFIRKFHQLPSLPNEVRLWNFPTKYGFGYDQLSDSYKVVAVFSYQCDDGGNCTYKTEVKVHTLGSNSWRRIQEFPSSVTLGESGKFVSGTLNWVAADDDSFVYWVVASFVVLSLDLGNESYQEILQPDYGKDAVLNIALGVLRDCLSIFSHGETFLDVWLMNEFGNKESWTKLCRVPPMGNSGPYQKVLCVSGNEEILLESFTKLNVYNYRNGTFKTPKIQNVIDADVHVESLISPLLRFDI